MIFLLFSLCFSFWVRFLSCFPPLVMVSSSSVLFSVLKLFRCSSLYSLSYFVVVFFPSSLFWHYGFGLLSEFPFFFHSHIFCTFFPLLFCLPLSLWSDVFVLSNGASFFQFFSKLALCEVIFFPLVLFFFSLWIFLRDMNRRLVTIIAVFALCVSSVCVHLYKTYHMMQPSS